MTELQKTLFVLNAMMLKAQGATTVTLRNGGDDPELETDVRHPVHTTYTTPGWQTVENAAHDLDVTYSIFSTDAGLKASVTKDVDGTQVRLVFPVVHNGDEAAVILTRILELYIRVQLWTLNPKEPIPGYGEQHDALFGWVD